MNIAIVGAGWAGLAAAITAVQNGHEVALFEATKAAGGRARALPVHLPNGRTVMLDNGQHILIGAYTETLRLMRTVGVDETTALLRMPLALPFPDGSGLRLPNLPAPLDVLAGIALHRGWTLGERFGLMRAALRWKRTGFTCDARLTVAELCGDGSGIPPRVRAELIEPLCVAALTTEMRDASAAVFLRVLRDALFAERGGSNLLLPRVDLGALFPDAALCWLERHDPTIMHWGVRVHDLQELADFDTVILACPAWDAARLAQTVNPGWAQAAHELQHHAIATVHAWHPSARLVAPMLALRSHGADAPAQFVFDRGLLGGEPGLLSFVVSASAGERADIEHAVLLQARKELQLELQHVQTVVEKRAAFACTPGLQRPAAQIAPRLLACGDYVAGPYPATLEGAIRSGIAAACLADHGLIEAAQNNPP